MSLILSRSTVYVEADLEMRPVPSNADGSAAPDRAFLRHRESAETSPLLSGAISRSRGASVLSRADEVVSLRVINRVRPEGEETPEGEE
jgi:hypothetical protein